MIFRSNELLETPKLSRIKRYLQLLGIEGFGHIVIAFPQKSGKKRKSEAAVEEIPTVVSLLIVQNCNRF